MMFFFVNISLYERNLNLFKCMTSFINDSLSILFMKFIVIDTQQWEAMIFPMMLISVFEAGYACECMCVYI